MQLTWYGHATFRIETPNLSVMTDPHNPDTSGYRPYDKPADVVLMSSATDDFHNNGHLISGNPEVVNTLDIALKDGGDTGTGNVHGMLVRAIAAMEVHNHPSHDPEQNAMYRFEVDGLHVGHMGDVGNVLTEEQLEFFAGVDVLLALTGGFPTIALDDLMVLIDRVQPKVTVPMHFRTLRYKPRNSLWIDSFLDYFDHNEVAFACDSTVTLEAGNLPEERVLVLDYA